MPLFQNKRHARFSVAILECNSRLPAGFEEAAAAALTIQVEIKLGWSPRTANAHHSFRLFHELAL